MCSDPPRAPIHVLQPGAQMREAVRQALLQLYTKELRKITEEDFTTLIEAISPYSLSTSELGRIQRTILFVRISQAMEVNTQTYSLLLRFCDEYAVTPSFVEAEPGERCYVKIAKARALIAASFDERLPPEEQSQRLKVATQLLREARTLRSRFSVDAMEADLLQQEKLLQGALKQEVLTHLRFDLPFPVPAPDGTYQMRLDRGVAEVDLVYRPPTAVRFGLQVEETGISYAVPVGPPEKWIELPVAEHNTRVDSFNGSRANTGFSSIRIKLPYFVESYGHPRRGSTFDPDAPLTPLLSTRLSEPFQQCTKVINGFIEHLRVASGRFDIDRITPLDIGALSIVTTVGGVYFMGIPLVTGGGPYRVQVNVTEKPVWMSRFQSRLMVNPHVEIEEVLCLDAKRFLMQGELRLALLNVNAALESFVNRHFRDRMASVRSQSDIDAFLVGDSIFESCRAELIKRALAGDVSAQVAADLMPTPEVAPEFRRRPSVFHMVTWMHKRVPFGLSTNKLKALINRIRDKRNEVAHGSISDSDLSVDRVHASIVGLEEFVQRANRTTK